VNFLVGSIERIAGALFSEGFFFFPLIEERESIDMIQICGQAFVSKPGISSVPLTQIGRLHLQIRLYHKKGFFFFFFIGFFGGWGTE